MPLSWPKEHLSLSMSCTSCVFHSQFLYWKTTLYLFWCWTPRSLEPNSSALKPHKGIETYVAIGQELGISLSSGYLFRAANQQGHIVDNALFSKCFKTLRQNPALKSTCEMPRSIMVKPFTVFVPDVPLPQPCRALHWKMLCLMLVGRTEKLPCVTLS